MTREEFDLLFRLECRQHKIQNVKLVFAGQHAKTLALTYGCSDQISIYDDAFALSYENAIELIRHELAHLLDYREHKGWPQKNGRNDYHGKSWKEFCRQLGCRARTQIPRNSYGF